MGNNKIDAESKRLGGAFLIIGWLMAISLFGYLLHVTMFSTREPSISHSQAGTSITLSRDYDSHFRIAGSINQIPVTFLIDTGATSIAISESLATKAKLEKKAEVITETANGQAIGYLTKIAKLRLNEIELNNISAIIIPGLSTDEALLGMNVLSKFEIKQAEDQLTIIVPAK